MDLVNKVKERKDNYQIKKSKLIKKYQDEKELIKDRFRKEVAEEEIKELRDSLKHEIKILYKDLLDDINYLIEEEEKEIKGLANKDIDPLLENNILLRLNLIKDNKKALYNYLDDNRENDFIVNLISDINIDLKDDDINILVNQIKADSRENKLERVKGDLRYLIANEHAETDFRDELGQFYYFNE